MAERICHVKGMQNTSKTHGNPLRMGLGALLGQFLRLRGAILDGDEKLVFGRPGGANIFEETTTRLGARNLKRRLKDQITPISTPLGVESVSNLNFI